MPTWLLSLWTDRKAILIAVACIALFSAGYMTRVKLDEANNAATLAAEAKAQKTAQAEADTKAAAWEKQLANMRAANKRLTRSLHDETKKAIYSGCVVPDDGVLIFNSALSGDGAGGASGSVP